MDLHKHPPLRERYTLMDFLYYTTLLTVPVFTAFYAISKDSTGGPGHQMHVFLGDAQIFQATTRATGFSGQDPGIYLFGGRIHFPLILALSTHGLAGHFCPFPDCIPVDSAQKRVPAMHLF